MVKTIYFFILLFFLSTNSLTSQNESVKSDSIFNIYLESFKNENYSVKHELYDKLDSIYNTNDQLIEWLILHKKTGGIYRSKLNKPFKAIDFYLKGATKIWRQPNSREEWLQLGWLEINLAYSYKKYFGEFDKAIFHYKKSETIFNNKIQSNELKYSKYYLPQIGNIYTRLGEYKKALHFLNLYKKICINEHNQNQLASTLNNIAIVYHSLGQNKKAIETLKEIKFDNNITSTYQSILHENLAHRYLDLNNLPFALEHINQSLQHVENIPSNRLDDQKSVCLTTLSKIKFALGDQPQAKELLQESIDLLINYYGTPHRREVAKLYVKLSEFNRKMGELDNALNNSHHALTLLFNNLDSTNTNSNPSPTDIYPENTISEALHGKALALEFIYREHGDQKYLDKALECYDLIFVVWKKLRATYEYEASQLLVLNENKRMLEKAIELSLLCYEQSGDMLYLSKAYDYCEQSKNLLLLEALNQNKANIQAGIPDSLLEHEHDLNVQINWNEKQLFDLESNPSESKKSDHLEIKKIKDQIFKLKESQKKFENDLELKYPEYFDIKYDNHTTTIVDVQNMITPGTDVIEYFVGDSVIYVFVISTKEVQVKTILLDFDLADKIEKTRDGLYNYWLAPSKLRSPALYDSLNNQYVENAHLLYLKLIAPLGELSSKLIIVPDGVLGYLPFEVLLKDHPTIVDQFKSHAYFAKNHTISYNYSSSLWSEMSSKQHNSDGLLAMAPVFNTTNFEYKDATDYRRGNLGELAWNIPEAKSIVGLVGGRLLTGLNATKEQFEAIAHNYSILHLATHAKLNDQKSDFSYLAFSNVSDSSSEGKIYVRDLYNYNLPLEMVVLSACETGIGKLEKGEGIISLARGFTYAGAKSIVNSLWEVNDKSASEIMTDFYRNLKDGQRKDDALQSAKLEYLDHQVEDRLAHPFFWAAFVPIGDMGVVELGGDWPLWVFYLGAFVLIMLLLGFRHYFIK